MPRPYVHTGPAMRHGRTLKRWDTAWVQPSGYPFTRGPDAPSYVDETRIVGVADVPTWWQERGLSFTASGYGRRIPTRYMLAYADGPTRYRWHRVYAIVAGNSGSLYIRVRGVRLFLTPNAEHALERMVG